MYQPKFSLIIPVYNTKIELLIRCMDSVILQTYKSYEIILVDDGSDSIYAKELDGLKNTYKNLYVYHIAHSGVSNARNIGVSLSAGDWIFFIDSDDVISKYMLEDASAAIRKNKDIEIVYGYIQYVDFNINLYERKASEENFKVLSYLQKKRLLKHFIALECGEFKKNKSYISRGPVARAIKKQLASKYTFDVNIVLGEDLIWNIEILKDMPKSMIVETVWYYYIRNDDSSVRRYRSDAIIEHCKLLNKLSKIVGRCNELLPSILSRSVESLSNIITTYYLHENYPKSLKQANEEFKQMVKMEQFSRFSSLEYFWKMTLKNKVKWIILMKNPFPLYTYKLMLLFGAVKK